MTATLPARLRARAKYAREEGNMTAECDAVYFEQSAARIEDLEAALRFIADGYENHNINHVDYRVRVYQVATEVLGAKND